MSADQSTAKAAALAVKLAQKVEDTLAPLNCEMAIMRWPADFRRIVWEAVASAALKMAAIEETKGASAGGKP